MPKHIMVVFTDPTPDNDEQYNTWYNEVHLPEVLSTEGFVRAQRYKVSDMMPGVTDHGYVAIYEMETDDPKAAMKALRGQSKTFNLSDAADLRHAKMFLASAVSESIEG